MSTSPCFGVGAGAIVRNTGKSLIFHCCSSGQITIPQIMPYDKIMELLRHRTCIRDMRKYNSAMAFASMPCNLDHTLDDAKKGFGAFRTSGQVMHKIGSIFQANNKASGFSRIYFYDPDMQATIRNNAL
jgi:hypothetical protein